MADKKLNAVDSATTVANFYGNNGGKDVQIPLATAASVLAGEFGCVFKKINASSNAYQSVIQSFYSSLPNQTIFICFISAGWHRIMIGFKSDDNFGCASYMTYTTTGDVLRDFFAVNSGEWIWF